MGTRSSTHRLQAVPKPAGTWGTHWGHWDGDMVQHPRGPGCPRALRDLGDMLGTRHSTHGLQTVLKPTGCWGTRRGQVGDTRMGTRSSTGAGSAPGTPHAPSGAPRPRGTPFWRISMPTHPHPWGQGTLMNPQTQRNPILEATHPHPWGHSTLGSPQTQGHPILEATHPHP